MFQKPVLRRNVIPEKKEFLVTPGPGTYESKDQFHNQNIKVKRQRSRNIDCNVSNPVLVTNFSGSLKRHTTKDSDSIGESKFENEIL